MSRMRLCQTLLCLLMLVLVPSLVKAEVTEGFESGGFVANPWVKTGDWAVMVTYPHTGSYSAYSKGGGATLKITVKVTASGDLSFWYTGPIAFSMDGIKVADLGSVTGPWSEYRATVSPGIHTFTWTSFALPYYSVYLDDIALPPHVLQHILSVTKTGNGQGSVTADLSPSLSWTGNAGSARYWGDEAVTLTATPAIGFVFAGWTGYCTGTAATCTVPVSQDRSVGAIFNDVAAPTGSISINSGGQFTNSRTVDLSLTASDSGGVAEMQFSNDNVTWSTAEPFAAHKTWQTTAGDGTRDVFVKFKDNAGNWSETCKASIVVDTTPPVLTLTSPASGAATALYVTVSGTVADNILLHDVALNGAPLAIDDNGAFSITVNLQPGVNSYTLTATDWADNKSTIVRTVGDSTPPALTVSSPATGSAESLSVVVAGKATDDLKLGQVTINGAAVALDETGAFSKTIPLNPGTNTFTITATDWTGNKTTESREIADATPPVLTVTSPDSGPAPSLTVVVAGKATDDLKLNGVTINGAAVALDEAGAFSKTVALQPGNNAITIIATDWAGNITKEVRMIADTTTPTLTLTSPAEGAVASLGIVVSGTVSDDLCLQELTVNGAPVTVNEAGTFYASFPLKAGANTFTVTATDWAGNQRTEVRTVTLSAQQVPEGYSIRGVAYGDGGFIAVGEYGTLLTSSDGTTWTTVALPTNGHLTSACFGDGKFVIAGEHGAVFVSRDRATWTAASTSTSEALTAVAFGAGRFVAVGDHGAIVTSEDGMAWSTARSTTSAALLAVAYGNSRFIAVGDRGVALASTDGTTWSSATAIAAGPLVAVTYGNEKFVAVGENGLMTASSNGENWVAMEPASPESLGALAFGDHGFLATGDFGALLDSYSGAGWLTRATRIGASLFAAAFGGKTYVVAGDYGTVATVPMGIMGLTYYAVSGTLKDSAGATLPDVEVSFTNARTTSSEAFAKTDGSGHFTRRIWSAGPYVLSAAKEGYRTAVLPPILLNDANPEAEIAIVLPAVTGGSTRYPLSVTMTGSGKGTITSGDTSCEEACSWNFPENGLVKLEATADPGSVFTGWAGADCLGIGPTCWVTMSASRAAKAIFDDVLAPDTAITTKPTAFSGTDAPFGFTATETGSSFECRLDDSPFVACSTPNVYTGLSDGTHIFAVRAVDAAGNKDHTPATCIWTSDGTPPVVKTFTVPTSITGMEVPFTSLTATDNIGVTGWLVTEGAAKPAPDSTGWNASPPASYTFSVPGSKTLYAWVRDGAGNVSTSLSVNVTVKLPSATITVSVEGSGSVNSIPAGVACTGTGTGCTASFEVGTCVELVASEASFSHFVSWSGGCAGNALNCLLTASNDTAITASFTAALPAKLVTATETTSYATLATAYAAAPANGPVTLLAISGNYNESLIMDKNLKVFLSGGQNSSFTTTSGNSSLHGALFVRQGTLRVRNVAVW